MQPQWDHASGADKPREFAFTTSDFNTLRRLVKEQTGIHLSDQKRELVYGRLSRRLRALGLHTFRDYIGRLSAGDTAELVEFCNAITTNLTAFFRESHHFDYIRDSFLAPRLADPHASRRLRIWHAGCSTGEEAYSLAITLNESIRDLSRWDVRQLATDIDSDVLARASKGVYGADRMRGISQERREKFFQHVKGGAQDQWQVNPQLRDRVVFKQLNLMHAWPMKGPLDVIFCRNVVIYFEKDTQRELFARMAQLQRPGDLLFLGHSESLFKVSDAYTLIGKTIYRRL
jgi:chemotaxis protein methyltransferase CheR